jgi:putative multiple sugar transport system permease protein
MVMIIIEGQIDISVGALCAFIGAISVFIYNTHCGIVLTLIATIICGLIVGAWNGVWSTWGRLPSFIVTMAGMWLFRGITYIITNINPVNIKIKPTAANGNTSYINFVKGSVDINALTVNRFHWFAIIVGVVVFLAYVAIYTRSRARRKRAGAPIQSLLNMWVHIIIAAVVIGFLSYSFAAFRGIPGIVVILAVVIGVGQFIMTSTPLGRKIYAVGGNPNAARLAGINSFVVIFIVFLIMGALSALAAVVNTAYMSTALPQSGLGFEMDAIAACYVGGVSAAGGVGTVLGVVIGGLVMAVINNGMTLMNVAPAWQNVIKGLVVILAVLWDVYSRRKAGLV